MIPEVEFCTTEVATVDAAALARVRQAAIDSPRLRARLCLHANHVDELHLMLIVLRRGTDVPRHRHLDRAECYQVLSGRLTLILYHDDGRERERIPLGTIESGRAILCRINAGLWHTVEVESEEVVLYEATRGPFRVTGTEYWTGPI